MSAKVFCTHLLRIEAYRVRKQQDIVIYFALYFFLFLFPSICDSNVRHREICVNNFSRNTALRILKVCDKIVFYLYYVKQNCHTPVYHSLYLNIFSYENPLQICYLLLEPVFKFCIHPDSGEVCYVRQNQDAKIYFFSPSLSCNTKENLHLQTAFTILLISFTGGMGALLTVYYIFQINGRTKSEDFMLGRRDASFRANDCKKRSGLWTTEVDPTNTDGIWMTEVAPQNNDIIDGIVVVPYFTLLIGILL